MNISHTFSKLLVRGKSVNITLHWDIMPIIGLVKTSTHRLTLIRSMISAYRACDRWIQRSIFYFAAIAESPSVQCSIFRYAARALRSLSNVFHGSETNCAEHAKRASCRSAVLSLQSEVYVAGLHSNPIEQRIAINHNEIYGMTRTQQEARC